MIYNKAIQALENYRNKKILPPKFNKLTGEGSELHDQIQAIGDELQSEIDEAQRMLDEIENFEKAWDAQ